MTQANNKQPSGAKDEICGTWFTPKPILDALGIQATYDPASGTGGWILDAANQLGISPTFLSWANQFND